jgi:ABC-type multidrug transport system ATPase subunit
MTPSRVQSTGLDPVNQKIMWKLVQTLKKDRAILLTTHSMREAEVLADRITLIAFGRICDSGTAFELKQVRLVWWSEWN